MNENVRKGQFALQVTLSGQQWLLNVIKRNATDVRYEVEAHGAAIVRFEMTTSSIGRWLVNTDELPFSIKENIQQIGKLIEKIR